MRRTSCSSESTAKVASNLGVWIPCERAPPYQGDLMLDSRALWIVRSLAFFFPFRKQCFSRIMGRRLKASLRAAANRSLAEAVRPATLTILVAGPRCALCRAVLVVSSALRCPFPCRQSKGRLASRVDQPIREITCAMGRSWRRQALTEDGWAGRRMWKS